MKVLLIKDVYKLGFAGEIKKVADGYGRNYLLPQGMAVLATAGAIKQADRIRETATVRRAELNEEMGGVAEQIAALQLTFPARAGETGKLYGSVTTRMVAEAIQAETGLEITAKQIDAQPIRTLGRHELDVRLTMDLVPQIDVVVYREGETAEAMLAEEAQAELDAAAEALEAEQAALDEEVDEAEAAVEGEDLEDILAAEVEAEEIEEAVEAELEAEAETEEIEEAVEAELEAEAETEEIEEAVEAELEAEAEVEEIEEADEPELEAEAEPDEDEAEEPVEAADSEKA